jgi:hypothetical protein
MLATIELRSPEYVPSDPRRNAERQKATALIVRQLIVQMVQAGWRESEAALSLADSFDDYCFYLAEYPQQVLEPANSNTKSGPHGWPSGRSKTK